MSAVLGTQQSVPEGQWTVTTAAVLVLALGSAGIWWNFDGRMAALLLLGGALGLVLYHAAFGVTSSWRYFFKYRRGAGLRAQMLMLAVANVLFLPSLAQGQLFDQAIVGAVAPLWVSLFVGAFVFGLGMQLGGGCGSGTLFVTGGGNLRMFVTLGFFILGSVLATAQVPWWFAREGWPGWLQGWPAISLLKEFGVGWALVMQLSLLAAIAGASVVLEKRRNGRLVPAVAAATSGWPRLLRGPWPLLWGAVLLALLNWSTLAIAGHPWGITYGFTLWGAKIGQLLGFDIGAWEFWNWPYHRNALSSSIFENTTSVMDMGVILGALLAAGLAGRFKPRLDVPLLSLLAAALGGLLMGYGARISFGCNIGAFVGGVSSASLHGWVWFIFAMAGTALGTRLRPLFGLRN